MRILWMAAVAAALATASCGRDKTGPRTDDCADGLAPPCGELGLLKKTFYEDNPTYRDPSKDDGFFTVSTPEAEGLDAKTLDDGVRALDGNPQMLSFMLLRHGKLVMEQYFHGSAATDANNIHSASKGVLSMLAGIALADGTLPGLDTPLPQLLPRFRVDGRKRGITLRHVLTMTAGFQWTEDETEYKIERRPNWVQAILDLPLATEPGSSFNYSTAQTHLLSAILTEAAGMPLAQYAQKKLFAPLAINVPHWGTDPQGYNSGGCNLYMTPRSLTKLAVLASNKGALGEKRLVPAAWMTDALKPLASVDDVWTYGYYWWLRALGGRPVQKLWGYGGQLAYLIPEIDAIAVFTTNTRDDYPEWDGDPFVERYVLPAVKGSTLRSPDLRLRPELR